MDTTTINTIINSLTGLGIISIIIFPFKKIIENFTMFFMEKYFNLEDIKEQLLDSIVEYMYNPDLNKLQSIQTNLARHFPGVIYTTNGRHLMRQIRYYRFWSLVNIFRKQDTAVTSA